MSTAVVLAGTKRKRYVPVEKDVSTKLAGKLHHGLREVRKAAKKAKAFETQRLVKKLKDLRKPGRSVESVYEDIKDVEAQLESLKVIDHEHIAYLALSPKLQKDKTLSSNDALLSALASAITSETKTPPETWHNKVKSRLLSSKVLAGEVGLVITSLKTILDPGVKVKPGEDLKGKALDGKGLSEGEESENELEDGANQKPALSDDNAKTDDEDIYKEKRRGLAIDEVDDLLDDDGWESGSIDDSQVRSEGSSAPPSKRSKHPPPARTRSALPEAEAASTFLPSLSVGFIKGDSDSDFNDSEPEGAEPERKNRRGQRARQAIWEKKYGKNAKHVKKQREETVAAAAAKQLGKHLDSGWGGHKKPAPKHGQSAATSDRMSSRVPNRLRGETGRHQATERPTHPSWEAKKKLKEKESAKILPSQGKKIVF